MTLNFDKTNGLIPAVVQDATTNKVLMLGYMDQEALELTKSTGRVTFFSRSKGRLWTKGETSGNFLDLVEIKEDCDQDTLLIKALPHGPTCHTGSDTCFRETNENPVQFLSHLAAVIADRRLHPGEESYTNSLFERGINKIAQKVGEEAVELVIEAKDDNAELFKNEAADLIFHLLVLLEAKDISLDEVIGVLKKRHKSSK